LSERGGERMTTQFKHHSLKSANVADRLPVFSDPTRRRSRRVKVFAGAAIFAFLLWGVTLGTHIFNVETIKFDLSAVASGSAEPLFELNIPTSGQSTQLPFESDADVPAVPFQNRFSDCNGPQGRGDAFKQGSRDIFAFLPRTNILFFTLTLAR